MKRPSDASPFSPSVGTAAAGDTLLIDAPPNGGRDRAGTAESSEEFTNSLARQYRLGWQKVILGRLTHWDGAGGAAEIGGFKPPSHDVLAVAYRVAAHSRNAGTPPPDQVVPDGDGGLVFERRDGSRFQSMHVYDDLAIELDSFEGGRLVSTVPLAPGRDS